MTYEILTALATFAFVTSITPGPNNLMLMTSGANFGFRRTIPHMLGVGLGFVFMVILVGIGLVQMFELYPISGIILKVASVVYMFYLAWKIALSAPPEDTQAAGKPITFIQAALFQWVNPKAWAMALTAVSVYAPSQNIVMIFTVAVVFGIINIPSVGSWTILGQQMRRFLDRPNRLRLFNFGMAFLLVISLYPVLGI